MGKIETDRWYRTAAWQRRRSVQLQTEPLCRMCGALANVVDHVRPHFGSYNAFVMNPLQSLCGRCHNIKKQRADRAGFLPDVDESGWPTDPRHPSNVQMARRKI